MKKNPKTWKPEAADYFHTWRSHVFDSDLEGVWETQLLKDFDNL